MVDRDVVDHSDAGDGSDFEPVAPDGDVEKVQCRLGVGGVVASVGWPRLGSPAGYDVGDTIDGCHPLVVVVMAGEHQIYPYRSKIGTHALWISSVDPW